jgi:hypothetical protein
VRGAGRDRFSGPLGHRKRRKEEKGKRKEKKERPNSTKKWNFDYYNETCTS